MKRSIAAGALLLLCHGAAVASPLRLAQADVNAPDGTAAPGGDAVNPTLPSATPLTPPPSTDTPADSSQELPKPADTYIGPPSYTGTQRNNPVTTPSQPVPSLGPLPYGGTQATVGVQNPTAARPYGGTQRDSVGAVLGDAAVNGGVPTYTGTQATIGAPQNLGNAGQFTGVQPATGQPYGSQPYGVPTTGSLGRGGVLANTAAPGAGTPSGADLQGNGTTYGRAPLGSMPVTRDQTGVLGGVGSYNARGVYTGVAPQPLNYGQVYATPRGVAGGLLGTGVDATGPLRPVIPSATSSIRANSGYGLPNGSKPTYMDARGIQRSN